MTAAKTNLKLIDSIICRTPVFSYNDEIEKCWPALKDMIQEASPAFYDVIAGLDANNLHNLNEKVNFSLWKYFNRGRYRATPYGNFAAVSLAPIAFNSSEPLTIQSKTNARIFNDWAEKDIHLDNTRKLVRQSEYFIANSTWYVVDNDIRYIKNSDGQFELAMVGSFPELTGLLNLCIDKLSRSGIYEYMRAEFDIDQHSVDDMLYQLVDCQLLLTERQSNITGEDYFTRLSLPRKNPAHTYIIAEREISKGCFDASCLKQIPEFLNFMKDFVPDSTNANLESFKKEFTRKFDQKAIPLSLAIDPETGVGYGSMEQNPQEAELGAILQTLQNNKSVETTVTFTAQYKFLLNGLIKGGTIKLEEYKGPAANTVHNLPNTLSILFSYYNGQQVIASAGGCTANSLIGRFTLANKKIENLGRDIANIEINANPDVLFFEVGYQAEKRVDNVNRRKLLYQYELPLLSWSCSSLPISLDDVLVLVRSGEVVLWSKKYNKRMVPRIASAYNYTRSDLAVYRFLCDLQSQNLKTNLTVSLQKSFPGLDHYPRVVYKNVIISAASWRVDLKEILTAGKPNDDKIIGLKSWLQSKGIDAHFKCGNSDQTLCFDPGKEQDLRAFITYCRQNSENELYIAEALVHEQDMITDENGKHYLPQYIANYHHEQQIYPDYKLSESVTGRKSITNDVYFPGSEWLYFEIYCNPARGNQVLNQYIRYFINSQKNALHKWFFIRYTDPKPHLRLRLQLKDVSNCGLVIKQLKACLAPLCNTGLVADIQLKTYFRESERYGTARMDMAEEFFAKDSEHVLKLIASNKTDQQLYMVALRAMSRLYELAIDDADNRVKLVKSMADNFSNEFSVSHETFKSINRLFENMRKEMDRQPVKTNFSKTYEEAFGRIITACKTDTEKAKAVADLVHMHVNRLFYTDQRRHEAILYQCLFKLMKAQKFAAAAQPEFLSVA